MTVLGSILLLKVTDIDELKDTLVSPFVRENETTVGFPISEHLYKCKIIIVKNKTQRIFSFFLPRAIKSFPLLFHTLETKKRET